jgi:hypothetical protein
MVSKGDVTLQGTLDSSPFSQGFILQGVLGGPKATEAAYSFKSTDGSDLSAAGVTHWSR